MKKVWNELVRYAKIGLIIPIVNIVVSFVSGIIFTLVSIVGAAAAINLLKGTVDITAIAALGLGIIAFIIVLFLLLALNGFVFKTTFGYLKKPLKVDV